MAQEVVRKGQERMDAGQQELSDGIKSCLKGMELIEAELKSQDSSKSLDDKISEIISRPGMPKHVVGLTTSVQEVEELLMGPSVKILGIIGMGGIGKMG